MPNTLNTYKVTIKADGHDLETLVQAWSLEHAQNLVKEHAKEQGYKKVRVIGSWYYYRQD
jgi:hypothetical protein